VLPVARQRVMQGIPKQLAVLAGAGGRPISRGNANDLAAKGNSGDFRKVVTTELQVRMTTKEVRSNKKYHQTG